MALRPHAPPLRRLREARGLAQQDLAARAGITRQSLSAIEAGRSQPSVAVALRLGRALGARVEELFDEAGGEAALLAEAAAGDWPGDGRVLLTHLDGRFVAHPLSARDPAVLARSADGVATGPPRSSRGGAAFRVDRVEVELLRPESHLREQLVVLGCAPALGLLGDRVDERRRGQRVAWLPRPSLAALEALSRGQAHVAGIHLGDGEHAGRPREGGNVSAVRRLMRTGRSLVFRLASWEAGIVVARGNPLGLRRATDLARPDLRLAVREPGAGARLLLERVLRLAGLDVGATLAGAPVLHSHHEVAEAVAFGAADAGIAMGGVARALDLGFVPLAEEPFDLVVPASGAERPEMGRLLDALGSQGFLREIASLGGYSTAESGRLVAEVTP